MAKRVAIVSDSAPPYGGGGIASAHYGLFRGFQRAGLETALFTFFDRRFPEEPEAAIYRFGPPPAAMKWLLKFNGLLFGLLDPRRKAWYAIDSLLSGLGVRRMAATLAQWQPDVVIFPDQGSPALLLPKPPGVRWGLIAHHNPMRFQDANLGGEFSPLDARLAVWFEQQALHKVDRVTCPSRHMQAWFERTYRFSRPLAVIPNIPDVESVAAAAPQDPRPGLGLSAAAPLIVVPSGEVRLKGTDFVYPILARLAQRFSQPFGVFIAGELEPGLAAQLPALPEHVRLYLPGRLAHSEYLGTLKTCSFGLFPALMDNYSMALVEATLAGVPMLAFDTGGNEDILAKGQNGYLFPLTDLTAADVRHWPASRRLLEPWEGLALLALNFLRYPERLETLRACTRNYRPTAFDPQAVVEEYIRFFLD